MNGNIQPQSIIEEIDVSADAPWDDTSFIDIQIPTGPKDIVAQKHREKHFFTHVNPKHICFYTDGSLLEGKAGTGIYVCREDEMVHESKYYLGTEAEVFDAELYGILKAKDIATHITRYEDITDVWIFCDNQSAVRRMSDKRPIPGQEYILKTHTSAEVLKSRGITVHIHWVPGHVQVKGNEKAEALAKQGTEGKRLPRDATTSITYLKRKNKEQQMEEWKRRWPGMRRGRSYQGRPATNIHPLLRDHPSRKLVATIIQMRTGHGYNKHYLARIPSSSIDSPKCTCGHWRQTPKHLLLECRHHLPQRKELRKQIRPLPLTWQTAIHTGKRLKGTIGFLTETGVGTRTWVLGPKMADEGSFGWSHINSEMTEGGRGSEEQGAGEVEMAEVVGVG